MKTYPVTTFGAVGDGTTKNTEAIQKAIDTCAAEGGGSVVLENGVFMSGSLTLHSNVNLHIEQNAVLLGSPDVADYPEKENLRHVNSEFLPRWRNASFIFAEKCHHVSITGRGTIDCNGKHFTVPSDENAIWKYQRIEAPTPPRVVFFTGCEDVVIEDVSMVNQPAGWSYWIHDCDNVRISKITIHAEVDYPNNDGIHINASRRVTVSDCDITCGDDCIVLRANNASLKENKVCEQVTVTNCNLTSYSAAVRIGWVQDGTIRNCTLSNLTMYDCSVGVSIFVPELQRSPRQTSFSAKIDTSTSDVGREATVVENISFQNIVMDKQCSFPVYIDICDNENIMFGALRGIRFAGMTVRGPELPYIKARKSCPAEDISFSDCRFAITDGSEFETRRRHGWTGLTDEEPYRPMTMQNVKRLSFHNTTFSHIEH